MIVLADERESLATDRLITESGALGAAGHDPDVLHGTSLPSSPSAPCELEVRDVRRGDRPYEREPVQVVADAFEQPLAAAQKRRHEAASPENMVTRSVGEPTGRI